MFLYLVQHGEAKKEAEDPERGLTDKGAEDVRKTAVFLKKSGVHVGEVFHSPKLRARQTAQLFAEQLKPEKGIGRSENLLPMDDPGLWAMRLAGMNEDLMLVGHLPFMAKIAGVLLCDNQRKTFVDFRMGGVVCLERRDNQWAIAWMVVPEMVR